MKFRIDCPCGEFVDVGEGAAGATFTCVCGRPIVVPSLSDMRTRAGVPTNAISPEFVVEHLLATGGFDGGKSCVACGIDTDATIVVTTECERAIQHKSGGFSWPLFLFLLIFCFPLWFWYLFAYVWAYQGPETPQEFGRDKIYPLPLRICQACRQKLAGPADIKQCLRKIQEYDLLLTKFPDANVTIDQ
jgi:hypothetical protein